MGKWFSNSKLWEKDGEWRMEMGVGSSGEGEDEDRLDTMIRFEIFIEH